MPDRKSFLLRADAGIMEAMQRWANDDLRSLNGQIEYLLRDALRRVGRAPKAPATPSRGSAPTEPDVSDEGDAS